MLKLDTSKIKQRLGWVDLLKGHLMLLVILGHAIQVTLGDDCEENHLWNLIYSFHMPAFMAISGWLAYRQSDLSLSKYLLVSKRRGLQLLVPYFIWSFTKCHYSIQALFHYVLYPDLSFWFLWVLFWICVIFNFAQLVSSKLKVNDFFLILGVCLSLVSMMVVLEIRVLGFQFIAYYFLFYTLGYYLHKYEDLKLMKKIRTTLSLVLMSILWASLAWGWTMHGLPSWLPAIPYVPLSMLQYAYRGFTALVAILVLFGFAPKYPIGGGVFNNAIRTIGVVSLGVYVVHLSIVGSIVRCINLIVPDISLWMNVTCAFIIVLVISYSVVWVLNKNKYSARLFLGKL